jgi:hypothetical protein
MEWSGELARAEPLQMADPGDLGFAHVGMHAPCALTCGRIAIRWRAVAEPLHLFQIDHDLREFVNAGRVGPKMTPITG